MNVMEHQIINRIKESVLHIAPDAEVILYGSQARGDASPDSDFDLLILVDRDKLSYADIIQITYPLYDLEIAYNISISPIVQTRKQWTQRPFKTPFYINVTNEGIRL